jgi:PAS domain S-box-containing protein
MDTGAEHLQLPQGLLNQVLSSMKEGLCLLDESENIIFCNRAAEQILGWTTGNKLSGKRFRDFIDERNSEALWRGLCANEPRWQGKARLKKQDGTFIPVDCSILISSELNQKPFTVVLFNEIQEIGAKMARNLRHIFESSMFGVFYGDIHNKILTANQKFLQMVGYSLEDFQMSRVGWQELTPAEYAGLDEDAVNQIKEYGAFKPYIKQFIRKDGERVDILIGGVVDESSPERVVVFVIDITDRMQYERSLVEGDMLFRALAECIPILVWLLNPKGELMYMNRALRENFGHAFEDIQGRGWENYVHPEDLPIEAALIRHAIETKTYFEYGDHRLLHSDGTYQWYRSVAGPVINQDGEYVGLIGIGINIQDRKMAEEKLTQYTRRLEQSNKELEHFAAIASHDLQEPLRKVMLFTDHIKSLDHTLKEEALEDIARIQRATGRMQHLINDLLDLSRITRRGQPFQKVDVKEITEEIIAELHYQYPEIRNRVNVNGDMTITADSNQLRQMMFQLLDNALKFHKPGLSSLVNVDIQPQEAGYCRITVSDDGIGIKEEHLGKIFDTFVRLHHGQDYPGTGIGLSLVQKIVERHRGGILVESAPGEGSKFIVTLPVLQDNA